MKPQLTISIFFLALSSPLAAEEPIKVLASFSIIGDMVKEIAGDKADIQTIVGPNADAHIYNPSISDARNAALADVIFVNGLGFETWAQDLIANSGSLVEPIIVTQGIEPIMVEDHIDPHAWNAIPNALIYVENIQNALIALRPEHAEYFLDNAKIYQDKLQALHEDSLKRIEAVEPHCRIIITAHDAFGYMAQGYGLEFLAPLGIDTEAEPSAQNLAQLMNYIEKTGAQALFIENIASPNLIQQISDSLDIAIGGRLFSDALSSPDGPAPSYYDMFLHNLNAILATIEECD